MSVSYHLNQFPPQKLELIKLIPLMGDARAALSYYDAILKEAIPNPQVLLSPLTAQEAVLSSRIEGTQATLDEVLRVEAGDEDVAISANKRDDVEEITNYRKALNNAASDLERLPLSQRLLKDAHRTLLQGVRGRNKNPGQYRKTQNYIGALGCTQETARFVPIAPNLLNDGMSSWEKFIHSEFDDPLIQLAVVHAEFEALHPFQDGNGRLGRLLIPLFLFSKGLLASPSFYISSYLENNREVYYDQLLNISKTYDWTPWCAFFLKALTTQAKENGQKASAILRLYERTKLIVSEQTRSQYAIQALDFMFKMPVFKSTDFVNHTGIPDSSARRILGQLREHPTLLSPVREAKGSQAAMFAFRELLNVAEGEVIL